VDAFGSVVVLVEDRDRWAAALRHLRGAGLYPEPLVGDARDVEAHRIAWTRASVRDAPMLVLDGRVRLVPGWRLLLGAAVPDRGQPGWHVLHLDDAREGGAYVVTADGAALLARALAGGDGGDGGDGRASAPDLTVAEVMARVPALEVAALDPAPARGREDSDGDALDAPSGELERLFGYSGAIPFEAGVDEVGADLYAVPFWTPEFARLVIRAAEAVDAWGSDDVDPVPGHEVSLATISPRLFAHVEDHVAAVVVPAMRQHWPLLEYHGLRDAFVIRYEAGEQEGLRLHHDVAQVSGSVRLSDDHEGGTLVFPRQGVSNEAIPVGRLLLWPSLVTHPHAAAPVTRGVKYGLTLWFELPG
jgi:hypothetical protein